MLISARALVHTDWQWIWTNLLIIFMCFYNCTRDWILWQRHKLNDENIKFAFAVQNKHPPNIWFEWSLVHTSISTTYNSLDIFFWKNRKKAHFQFAFVSTNGIFYVMKSPRIEMLVVQIRCDRHCASNCADWTKRSRSQKAERIQIARCSVRPMSQWESLLFHILKNHYRVIYSQKLFVFVIRYCCDCCWFLKVYFKRNRSKPT